MALQVTQVKSANGAKAKTTPGFSGRPCGASVLKKLPDHLRTRALVHPIQQRFHTHQIVADKDAGGTKDVLNLPAFHFGPGSAFAREW